MGQPSGAIHDTPVDLEDEVQSIAESSMHFLESEHICSADPEPEIDEEVKLVLKTAEPNSSNEPPEAVKPNEPSLSLYPTMTTKKGKKPKKKGKSMNKSKTSHLKEEPAQLSIL